jgi:hypothetical protein
MQLRARRRVHLNQIAITSPCTVPWETMQGDDRVRFCGQCRQRVFNVAGLMEREAARLIAYRQGHLCARIMRRSDGTIVTADCRERLHAARRRGLLHFGAVLLLVVVPELLSMRFGIGYLRRLVGLVDAEHPPTTQVDLRRAPVSDHDVMLGGLDLLANEPEPSDPAVDEGPYVTSVGLIGTR